MPMLSAWSILNKVQAKGDARFSDVVLVVCPNVTIRNRLRELDPNLDDASIYVTRDLVPRRLGIPYLHNGEAHEYVPDFLVRLTNGVHLILETKGYDPLEDVKPQAARRWVDAVNADGAYGERRYAVIHDMAAVADAISEIVRSPAASASS